MNGGNSNLQEERAGNRNGADRHEEVAPWHFLLQMNENCIDYNDKSNHQLLKTTNAQTHESGNLKKNKNQVTN